MSDIDKLRGLVKPLEWKDYPSDGGRVFEGQNQKREYLERATHAFGTYFLMYREGGHYSLASDMADKSEYQNAADARAAAQSDYEQRVISALNPVAATALLDRIADLEDNLSESEKDTHYWVVEHDKAKAKLDEARADALEEAARCIEEGFDRGIPTKMDQCAHGKFGWEDCDSCAAAAIRALKSGGANG